ncbi:diguanylate cyclase [uncultured Pseudodesulfovibrio sp.]|uniref:diguanylate cyclase n=1 Tax=uncultured Pseudodesulfovibrio sp. TaxID=2035858 RepID=UPI0029C7E160|nr:diguanylate cyclase [uncultured Pseudodesulfovibrio sp.]
MPKTSCPTRSCNGRHVLLLDSNESRGRAVAEAMAKRIDLPIFRASTRDEAIAFMEDHETDIFAAVICLKAPEAATVMERLSQLSIRAVVYASELSDEERLKYSTWNVADLILRDSFSIPLALSRTIEVLARNRNTTILVVDDSRSMRAALIRFLSLRCYCVVEALNGREALNILEARPEIQLVITDNEMPIMDGYLLIQEIRKRYTKEEIAVIGISAKTNALVSVKFINNGANDFLHKPFVKEELYCRVEHNVEMLNRIATIRDLSYRDPLTRLYNRRYFFENCDDFATQAEAEGKSVIVAMLDIDNFKQFNDTYGHDVGDKVLRTVSSIMESNFPDNAIVARLGGEEFCILAAHPADDDLFGRYDKTRRTVEHSTLRVNDEKLAVTVSIGICTRRAAVSEMLKKADANLYTAKESGRNQIVLI